MCECVYLGEMQVAVVSHSDILLGRNLDWAPVLPRNAAVFLSRHEAKPFFRKDVRG